MNRLFYMTTLVLILICSFVRCEKDDMKLEIMDHLASTETEVQHWDWSEIGSIPRYQYPTGVEFGDGLFVDIAYGNEGIGIENDLMNFRLEPEGIGSGLHSPSLYNFRSEIRTAPWMINHPLKTEQWIGWSYVFPEDYQFNPYSPLTIFQNHPGIMDEYPQIELEIAATERPENAKGGEIQVVGVDFREVTAVRPEAGDKLDIVIHVVFGEGSNGLLRVWLDGELVFSKNVSTVYPDYPWGGNNKWGLYHHTYLEEPELVEKAKRLGVENVEISMTDIRLVTRAPGHVDYLHNAYDLVKSR